MATANDRVDTRSVGLLLVGFVLLLFGIYGLQVGHLFGTENNDLPLDYHVLAEIGAIVGLILLVLAVFAYRTGKSNATIVFPLIAMFFFVFYIDVKMDTQMGVLPHSSNWFLYVALAIFYLIIAIFVFVQKAPRSLSVLLLFLGLVTLFYGIACIFGRNGPNFDTNVCQTLGIVIGIFSFLAFIVAIYLGLAYADPKKIPLI